jgi:predicted HTH domain antitoxin
MLIEISDVGLTAQELRQELAVALYQQCRTTPAKAAEIAEVTLDFQHILAARQIPVRYGLDVWARDLQGLREQYDR